jgi:hypothetical protein
MKRSLLVLLLSLATVAGLAAARCAAQDPLADKPDPELAFDPTDRYTVRHIERWDVLINQRLLDQANRDLGERVLRRLDDHLYRITCVVPDSALANLRRIAIWVELAEPHHPCMCYHESAGWLREHGMNPQKAGGVELANARNFLSWTITQPWMVLHELAHGYHHQVLGTDHAGIRACYQHAVESKAYDLVAHYDGKKVRAYALTNEKEYFAECTEAYFGTNDFYPFVRAELKEHDPGMCEMLEKVWRVHKSSKK